MNLDVNFQKILSIVLKKWKLVVIFALIGTAVMYAYTANFTTQTYTSSVEFLAYADDVQQELNDSMSYTQQAASYTSKMNYAMKTLSTYVELFKTNEFNQTVADELNKKYSASYSSSYIKGTTTIAIIEDTSMFKITVTTSNADTSYQIAKQLETSIPEKMKTTNNGIVNASIEDSAVLASTSESPKYTRNCIIGLIAGVAIAAAYIILRDLLDVRVKSADDLSEKYDIPILGIIPEFELKSGQTTAKTKQTNNKKGE